MTRKIDVSKLPGIFQMISNVSERVKFHYGTPPDDVVNFLLRAMIAPPAHGALDSPALLKYVKELPKPSAAEVDPNKTTKLNSSQFRFSTTLDTEAVKISDVENPRALIVKMQQKGKNSTPEFKSINMIDAMGAKDDKNYKVCPVTFILSTMPFLNPAVGRSADIEIFLNFMPSYVLSRMVPYVDVEFQFSRPFGEMTSALPSPQLSSPGLLKFLNGAIQFNAQSQNPNDVMALGHRILRDKDSEQVIDQAGQMKTIRLERSYAGMELFTSPQTLVNPEQLDPSQRYKTILDPFRPFMTLVSFQLNVAPTVGYGTYKTGTMVIKLHDRSRLTEIGDLLQPEIYTRTTMWITYGWMHPRESDNPYADFVNNNLLTRELYGIKNAAYVFENDGQVTITLQLYTLGASELMDLKISAGPSTTDGSKSIEATERDMRATIQQVAYLANKMGLIGTESGGTADIRAYQIINNASHGEFPNLKETNVQDALKKLAEGLRKAKVDQSDATALVTALEKMYAIEGSGKDKKYAYDESRKRTADSIVMQRLAQAADNTKDPWLPWTMPDAPDKNSPYSKNAFDQKALTEFASKALVTLGTNSKDTSTISGVCSLGKLIATFVAQQVAEAQIADEFQVFFYAFNESAGAAAGECIANFPIDLTMFYDQFSLHVQQTGTSRMSVSEFMRFVIDAQLHDPRSLGYGTRTYYKPFLKGESAAMLEDKKKREEYEDWATRNTSKYGPFHIPTIDTYLEAVPLISDAQTMVDFLSDVAVGRSAKEEFYNQQGVRRALKGKYAIRLHIYDKQLNPYKAVETAIKPPSDKPGHMVLISQNEDAVDKYRKDKDKVTAMLQKLYSGQELNQQEAALSAGVFVPMDLSTNQNVKDYISSMVPTITFGGNASTVISAQLSTNQDALLSSVQMMKQSGRTNPQSPAGAGPGGLPITVIPGQLTMTTLGCPMAQLTQKYFVDFNTGTTADNIYCVNKLSHTFSPGKFETSWTFVWADAYGRIAGGGDLKDYLKFLSKSLQTPSTDNKGKKSNKSKDKKNSQ